MSGRGTAPHDGVPQDREGSRNAAEDSLHVIGDPPTFFIMCSTSSFDCKLNLLTLFPVQHLAHSPWHRYSHIPPPIRSTNLHLRP